MLRSSHIGLGATVLACAACSSYPAPNQRMADAMATSRAAQEVGANASPLSQLHLKLANEQIERARKLMADGDNKRADFILVRAKADADLALAQAHEIAVQREARAAIARAEAFQSELGEAQAKVARPPDRAVPVPSSPRVPVGTTTTTGSTVPGPVQAPAPPPALPTRPNPEGGAR